MIMIMNSGYISETFLPAILFFLFSVSTPYIAYFGLMLHQKKWRRLGLLGYIQQWNQEKNNGIFLSFGGGGTVRGISVGSDTGGTYEHFYMATWDPKGLLVRGYLHVFVNYQKHYDWCQRNNEPFVPPVPPHQQSIDQQIASTSFQAPDNFQVPAGYTLVPQNPTPHYAVKWLKSGQK